VNLLEYVFLSILFMSAAFLLVFLELKAVQRLLKGWGSKRWMFYSYLIGLTVLLIPFSFSFHTGSRESSIAALDEAKSAQTQGEKGKSESGTWYAEETSAYGTDKQGTEENLLENNPTEQSSVADQTFVEKVAGSIAFQIAAWIWLAGIVLLCAFRMFVRIQYTHKLQKKDGEEPMDETWRVHLNELLFREASKLGFRRIPRIKMSKAVKSPMIFGIVKSTIYLPADECDEEELAVILKHELIHYKRHDLLYKELAALAKMLHWFNPLVWKMEKEIDAACELSCDEAVIRNMNLSERKFYSKTILMSIYKEKNMGNLAMATLNKNDGLTEMRIHEILGFDKKQQKTIAVLCLLCLTIGITTSSIVTAAIINDKNDASLQAAATIDQPIEVADGNGLGWESKSSQEEVPVAEELGESFDVTPYMQHPKSYTKEELDKIFTAYVKETKDIGVLFVMAPYLSEDAVEQIVRDYVIQVKDYAILSALKGLLSEEEQAKLENEIGDELGEMDFDWNGNNWSGSETTDFDWDGEEWYDSEAFPYMDMGSNTWGDMFKDTMESRMYVQTGSLDDNMLGTINISADYLKGTDMLAYRKLRSQQNVKIHYNLSVTSGTISLIYEGPNGIRTVIADKTEEGDLSLGMLNGQSSLYLEGTDAQFKLTLTIEAD